MKTPVKLYVISAILFIFSLFLIFNAIKSGQVSTVPFEGTVEKAENTDISGYEYFRLSEGYAIPYATVYQIEEPANNVTQIVYPFVSKAYMEKARDAYVATHGSFDTDGFGKWLETYKVKPKFYIQAEAEEMSETAMTTMMLADTLAKKVEGTRIRSTFSTGQIILSECEKQGITIENSVFIDEGSNPVQDKETAGIVLKIGYVIAVIAVILFFLGRLSAVKRRKKLDQMER